MNVFFDILIHALPALHATAVAWHVLRWIVRQES